MHEREPDWLRPLFEAIDAKDTARFAAMLAPDVTFRFGRTAPRRGRDEAHAAVQAFFRSIAAVHHRLDDVWCIDGEHTVICRGEVRYTRLVGSELVVPFANVLRHEDPGI